MAASDDKKVGMARIATDAPGLVQRGKCGSSSAFKNLLASIHFPFADSVSPAKDIDIIYCRTSPQGDADYDDLPIGSLAVQLEITSEAVSGAQLWIHTGSGANDWERILTGPSTTSRTAYTAAKSMLDVRGTNSGTGDFRALYGRIELTHASAGSGDALRGYALAKGGVNALRGAHLTAEVAAGGSVVGLAVGATCQITTVTGLTLSGGTIAALDLVSDLTSAVTGMTAASFIRVSDNQTAKLQTLFNIDSSATGVVGATTAATAAGTLKVLVAGTVKYIQLYSSAS